MSKPMRDFFRSLNFRIMVFMILVGTIPALVIFTAFLSSFRKLSLTQLDNDVRNQCQILATQLGNSDYFQNMENEALIADMLQVANLYDGRIIVIDQNFRIVEDTYGLEEGQTIVAEEVVKSFKGESTTQYVSNRFLEMTVPITTGEEQKTVQGVILASASTDNLNARVGTLQRSMVIWSMVGAVVVIALSIFLANVLVRPLRLMNKSVEGFMEGAMEENLEIHDSTETEKISNTFNILLAKLRHMEESRQEFVANVSHELKTPMASMKVLADSLLVQKDAPAELYQEFMEDIGHEIDRENNIISDLLTMVKMDRKTTDMNIVLTDINEFLEQILKRLRPIAEAENVELIFESMRSVSAEIDATRLSLAFSNLVENGIKYNKKDGWVRVNLDADHKFFYVKVGDSGMGIPQESLDYIFERFYRVDKSHSREIGGTGLGLAITKSAVVAHRGAIKVQSEPDVGTTFTVRIPLRYIP